MFFPHILQINKRKTYVKCRLNRNAHFNSSIYFILMVKNLLANTSSVELEIGSLAIRENPITSSQKPSVPIVQNKSIIVILQYSINTDPSITSHRSLSVNLLLLTAFIPNNACVFLLFSDWLKVRGGRGYRAQSGALQQIKGERFTFIHLSITSVT